LVSGDLISAQRYFEQLGQQYSESFKAISTLAADFSSRIKERTEAGSQKEPYLPNFVHLMNARFYVPGNQPPLPSGTKDGVLWRGRISAIDGLTLGSITTTPG